MQEKLNQEISVKEGEERMFRLLGTHKIMALASSVQDYVMVRNVSCLFYDGKIYFKTDKNFRKTQQLFQNPNVALCWNGVQVEGTAENKGLVIDEPGRKFEKLYEKYLKNSYKCNIYYLNIYQEGGVLFVKYTNSVGAKKVEKNFENIYASKDGVIQKIDVSSGNILLSIIP